jgi:outer membrane protein assembly factor BamB
MPISWNLFAERGSLVHLRAFCALLFSLAVVFRPLPLRDALHAQPGTASLPGFSLVWRKSIQGVTAISLSPQGQRLALITDSGKLACWAGEDARRLWSVPTQKARNLMIADGPGTVLTYDALNPLFRKVTAYDAAKGRILWAHTADGAVWSAAVTRDGTHACVGTGGKSVYLYALGKVLVTRRFTLPGICESLAFSTDDQWLAVGLWDASGIQCLDLTGKTLWSLPGRTDRRYDVWGAGDRYVLGLSRANTHDSDPTVYVLRAKDGAQIWAHPLGEDCEEAIPAASDLAVHVGVSYSQSIASGPLAAREQRLASFDPTGKVVWEKGGLFFSPTLMCMAPDGAGMIVYDGQRTLYRLDEDGRIAAHSRLSDDLRAWSVTADDKLLLVYTHDGQLTMLKIG